MSEMAPRYEPQGVEERWQRTWEQEGLYNAEVDPARTPYVDAHPPPNVTGELLIGHALQLAIGDTMIRWKRMAGFNTLFQPGYDHAGISTQNVVEKVLLDEGTSRQELGREAFVERVWEWLHEYGGEKLFPFPPPGAALPHPRTPFTQEEGDLPAGAHPLLPPYERGGVSPAPPGPPPPLLRAAGAPGRRGGGGPGPGAGAPGGGGGGQPQKGGEKKFSGGGRGGGLRERRDHSRHSVARCERCETRIEPLISMQW